MEAAPRTRGSSFPDSSIAATFEGFCFFEAVGFLTIFLVCLGSVLRTLMASLTSSREKITGVGLLEEILKTAGVCLSFNLVRDLIADSFPVGCFVRVTVLARGVFLTAFGFLAVMVFETDLGGEVLVFFDGGLFFDTIGFFFTAIFFFTGFFTIFFDGRFWVLTAEADFFDVLFLLLAVVLVPALEAGLVFLAAVVAVFLPVLFAEAGFLDFAVFLDTVFFLVMTEFLQVSGFELPLYIADIYHPVSPLTFRPTISNSVGIDCLQHERPQSIGIPPGPDSQSG